VVLVLVVGLLGAEPLVAEPVAVVQAVEGGPPVLSLPEVEPPVPESGGTPEGGVLTPAEEDLDRRPVTASLTPPAQGEPVSEVVEGRGAVTEVWANTDGSRTITVHGEPINYQPVGVEAWERIDNTLVPDVGRPGWVVNAANRWGVSFGPIGPDGAGGVELSTDAGVVRVVPELSAAELAASVSGTAGSIAPVVGMGEDADTVTYAGVWPGVDVVYSVSGGRLKEDIVVSDGELAEFPFVVEGLGLMAPADDTPAPGEPAEGEPAPPVAGASEALEVTGVQDGTLALLAPEVLDGEGRPADEEAAPVVEVEAAEPPAGADGTEAGDPGPGVAPEDGSEADAGAEPAAGTDTEAVPEGRQRVTVAVDEVWLAGEATEASPVVVDPTIVIGTAWNQAYRVDGTWCHLCWVQVGNDMDFFIDSYWRSHANFDFGPAVVAAGGQVTYAGLWMNQQEGYAGATDMNLHLSNGPDWASAVAGTKLGGIPGVTDFVAFDVTAHIRNLLWQGFGSEDFGFSGSEVEAMYTWKKFNANLVINVNDPPPAPALVAPENGGRAIVSTRPTLSWNPVTDPNGQAVTYIATLATGIDAASGMAASSGPLSGTTWQVPAGVMRDGVTYYWKVEAFDGLNKTSSGVRKITVDLALGGGAMAPTDAFGGVTTNLVTGNAALSVAGPEMATVGGGVGVDFVYNSLSQPTGLTGQYRSDADGDHQFDASDPVVLSRTDERISFDWAAGSPTPAVPTDDFLVRWTGTVVVPPGSWQFGARSDDGVQINIDGQAVLNKWQTNSIPATPWWQAGGVTAGIHTIRVDYYEDEGLSGVELWARRTDGTDAQIVPASWFSPEVAALPDGWSLQAADISAGYTRAKVSDGSVTLYQLDGSALSFPKNKGGSGYTPPEGVGDVVTVNEGGTVTVQSEDGNTYTFRADGPLASVTSALEDRKPAAALPAFDAQGRLTQLQDPVSGRGVTFTYKGAGTCPANPSGMSGLGAAPTGMLCKVAYWDGTSTDLFYSSSGLLAYIRNPGTAYYGFSYDTTGRLIGHHDPLAYDAAMSGSRTDWAELVTTIGYDTSGRVSAVTPPPALQGSVRPLHSYTYAPASSGGMLTGGTATVTRAGVAGVSRTVAYDKRGRLTTDTDALGRATTTTWNGDDLTTASQAPDGLRTTTFYNSQKLPTDVWGPAPAAAFNADGTGNATVPRQRTAYDTNPDGSDLFGLQVAYWDNATMAGPPVKHDFSPGALDESWGENPPTDGVRHDFSARYTGEIVFSQPGSYSFKLAKDDKANLYINDTLNLGAWTSTPWEQGPGTTITTTKVNETRRIRIDFADGSGPANLRLAWHAPGTGGHVTVPDWALRPAFGLTTATTDPDGNLTRTAYTDATSGISWELGLATATTVDPAGLALKSTTTYEAPGAGFLRRTARSLPAGTTSTRTTNEYWGDTATSSGNPCVADGVNQGGMLRYDTAADPDGAGGDAAIVRETIYDSAGRAAGSRIGTDDWTCTSYDARGRVTEVSYPAYGGSPARTVTTVHAVDADGGGPQQPNPLVTSVNDPAGTIKTTVDLAGQVVSYTDVFNNTTVFTYDQAGRETANTGPAGAITKTYDAEDQLTGLWRGGQPLAASLAYDSAGRLINVTYPAGAGNGTAGTFTYDTLGRMATVTWAGPGGTMTTDQVTVRTKAGDITDQTTDGYDPNPAGANYTYDRAGRLTQAWAGDRRIDYTFGTITTAACGLDALLDTGKNTNRTAMTITPNGGTPATTGYCYDRADRLTSATDPLVGTVDYDSHGNTTNIFGETHTYDVADRHMATTKAGTTVAYVRDATDRIVERNVNGTTVARYGSTGSGDAPEFTTDAAGTVLEVTYSLPGGALLTTRSDGNVWSYPNIHGDIVVTADQTGTKQGPTRVYDPYGNSLTGTTPDNSAGNLDYGWLGQHQRPVEHEPTLQPVIEMGARQYSPLLGRFLEIDPIEGGSANDYDYVNGEPVSTFDLAGTWGFRNPFNNWGSSIRNRIRDGVDRVRGTARGIRNRVRRGYGRALSWASRQPGNFTRWGRCMGRSEGRGCHRGRNSRTNRSINRAIYRTVRSTGANARACGNGAAYGAVFGLASKTWQGVAISAGFGCPSNVMMRYYPGPFG
jgi:RHS repeat-associated protein